MLNHSEQVKPHIVLVEPSFLSINFHWTNVASNIFIKTFARKFRRALLQNIRVVTLLQDAGHDGHHVQVHHGLRPGH